ncbi:MAG TPA: LCP family protein [Desulfotomaculum sp.]|nr:LCP family protein [Desulfotomaculum sp.]
MRKTLPLILSLSLVVLLSTPPQATAAWPASVGRQSAARNDAPAGPAQNVLIFWTDGPKLKAITLMAINPGHKPVGIVSIPINTRLYDVGGARTLEELYRREGRPGTTAYLEKRFGISINNYVDISQDALARTSDALGPVEMAGKKTSLLEVFEGTYTSQRMDLQAEIRALAARLIEPAVLVKIPRLLWIFTTGTETNMGAGNILTIYNTLRGNGPEILRKQALPGRECFTGTGKYREVSPDAWSRVLRDVTSA